MTNNFYKSCTTFLQQQKVNALSEKGLNLGFEQSVSSTRNFRGVGCVYRSRTKLSSSLTDLDTTNTPNSRKFYNQCFDKGRLKNFVLWFLINYGEHKTVKLVEHLKNVGFDYASKAGISLGVDDLKIPPKKTELMYDAEKQSKLTVNQYIRGEITGVERFQRLIDTWHRTSEILKQEVIEYFEATDLLNPVYMMAFSGARGNISQVRQLVGMRGLMADPQGQIIDFPIRSNFREGLTLTEYIISSYGARKGIVDTALRTANAGYLTRRLVDVAQHVIISNFDCGTRRGIFLINMKDGNKTIHSLTQRSVGRILARDLVTTVGEQKVKLASRNDEITLDLAFEIGKHFEKIFVRSPLTCETSKLICQLCYGWSLAQGNLVSIGEAVGVVAAQSIGEPGTQLTMRTFHTGGVFSGDISDQIRAPFDGIVEYISAIPGTLIRTPEGKIAFLTKGEGSFIVRKEESGIDKTSNSSSDTKKYKIPFYTLLYIRNGQKVYEKEVIAQISSISRKKNATDDAELTIKAECEGQFYSRSLGFKEKYVGPKQRLNKSSEDNSFPNPNGDLSSERWTNKPVETLGTTQSALSSEFYKDLSLKKYKSFEETKEIDKYFEAWTWGYAWILSGKIYELKYASPIYPKLGDLVTIKSSMNQTNWKFDATSGSAQLFIDSLKTSSPKGPSATTSLQKSSLEKKGFLNVQKSLIKPFMAQPLFIFDLNKIMFKKYGYVFQLNQTSQFFNSTRKSGGEFHKAPPSKADGSAKGSSRSGISTDSLFFLKALNSSQVSTQTNNLCPHIIQWFPSMYQTLTGGTLILEPLTSSFSPKRVSQSVTRTRNTTHDFMVNKYKQKYSISVLNNSQTLLPTGTVSFPNPTNLPVDSLGVKGKSLSTRLKGALIKQNVLNQSKTKLTSVTGTLSSKSLLASPVGTDGPKGPNSAKNRKNQKSLYNALNFIATNRYALFAKGDFGGMRWKNLHEVWLPQNSVNTLQSLMSDWTKNLREKNIKKFNTFYHQSNLFNMYSSRLLLVPKQFFKLQNMTVLARKTYSDPPPLKSQGAGSSSKAPLANAIPLIGSSQLTFSFAQFSLFFAPPLFILTNRQGHYQPYKKSNSTMNVCKAVEERFKLSSYTLFQLNVLAAPPKAPLATNLNPLLTSSSNELQKFERKKTEKQSTSAKLYPKIQVIKELPQKGKNSLSKFSANTLQTVNQVNEKSDKSKMTVEKSLSFKKFRLIHNQLIHQSKSDTQLQPSPLTSKENKSDLTQSMKSKIQKEFSIRNLKSFCKKTFVNNSFENYRVKNSKMTTHFEENNTKSVSNYLVSEYQKFQNIKSLNQFFLVMSDKNAYKPLSTIIASKNFDTSCKASFCHVPSAAKGAFGELGPLGPSAFGGIESPTPKKTILINKEYLMDKISSISYTQNFRKDQLKNIEGTGAKSSYKAKGLSTGGQRPVITPNLRTTNTVSITARKGWVYLTDIISSKMHKKLTYPGKAVYSSNKTHQNIYYDVPVFTEYLLLSSRLSKFNEVKLTSLPKFDLNFNPSYRNGLVRESKAIVKTSCLGDFQSCPITIRNSKSRYYLTNYKKKETPALTALLIQPVEEYNQFDLQSELRNKVYKSMNSIYSTNIQKTSPEVSLTRLTQTTNNIQLKVQLLSENAHKGLVSPKGTNYDYLTSLTFLKSQPLNMSSLKQVKKALLYTTQSKQKITSLLKHSDGTSLGTRASVAYQRDGRDSQKRIIVNKSFDTISKYKQHQTTQFNKQTVTSLVLAKTPSSDITLVRHNLFTLLTFNSKSSPGGQKLKQSLETTLNLTKNFNTNSHHFRLNKKQKNDRKNYRKIIHSTKSTLQRRILGQNIFAETHPSSSLFMTKPMNLGSFMVSYTKPYGKEFSFKHTKSVYSYQPFLKADLGITPVLDSKVLEFLSFYQNQIRLQKKSELNAIQQTASSEYSAKYDGNSKQFSRKALLNSVNSFHNFIPRLFESPCFGYYLLSNLNTNLFNTRYGKQKRVTSRTKFIYSPQNFIISNQTIAKTNYYSPFIGEVVHITKSEKTSFAQAFVNGSPLLTSTFNSEVSNNAQLKGVGNVNLVAGESNSNNKEVKELLNNVSCMILTKADLISYYLPSTFVEYKKLQSVNTKSKYVINDILVRFFNMTDINLSNLEAYLGSGADGSNTSDSPNFSGTNLKISKLTAGKPLKPSNNLLGDFFVYGDQISTETAVKSAGQIIHYSDNKITLRHSQPILISPKGILHKFDGDFIDPKTPVITLSYQRLKTGDIIQGIPKVEQFFEARTTKRGRLFRDSLPSLLKALFKRYQAKLPLDVAVRQSFYKIQQIIVDGVQRVYKSQGVTIADKHLEVIVKQMTSKVRIIDGAQTGFFPGEVVDLEFVEKINSFLIKKITYEPLVLGITKASLEVDSFLSAASFQQTTRVLSKAAISRKKDFLKGLKENVILGNLIPAGTGYLVYLNDFNKK